MRIIVQRKVEIWVEDIYDIEDESQIDLGPIEIYDEKWNLIKMEN